LSDNNKDYSKLLINCKSPLIKNKKSDNSLDIKKKFKLIDKMNEQSMLIRKVLKEQMIKRNKIYYTHSFNLYLNNNKNSKNNKNKDDKYSLKDYILNNSLNKNNSENSDNNEDLIIRKIPKAKIPNFMKFGNNLNDYSLSLRKKLIKNINYN